MVMEEVFKKLHALQEVLSEKIALEREIEDIPKMLLTQEELLSRLKKSFIEKNQEYETVRSNANMLRGQLAEAESAREKAEKHMDSITTQREYEALDKEIRDASEREQQHRKDLQKEDRLFSELDEQQKRDAALIDQQEKELAEKRSGVEAEISARKSESEALADKEKDITPGLDPDILFKFDRIIRSKLGLGIVAIKGGVCNGCHMILPAEFANMVRSGEEIVFCPYCSRILFYQEADQGEQDFFDEEDAGSLSDLDDLDSEEDEEYEDEETEEGGEEKSEMGYEE
ncbi:MAG: nucleic acid-binding protein [Treponema sp. GWB1_62_6]|nr:MAG: nucleic acid-binding protein [Treponema sp. GWA1_62_8]OHE65066.1 MAG: nucleic acid-binding protein [Treponema sp. GWC1_61_84]OHE65179.1 MAG: nucleic acid-binding protein [Treponema sp. GWB1_62_6]OHE72446.1 MAG: nucleic acid-binding protein [Treponema sp. RIFOXYC1_FULL_61_9]HCM26052.1 nucleic acid-binding protein [Treponema sp.]